MTDEIKPCPFCGVKIKIKQNGDVWELQHPKSDCFMGRLLPFSRDVEDMTERWNRRVEE